MSLNRKRVANIENVEGLTYITNKYTGKYFRYKDIIYKMYGTLENTKSNEARLNNANSTSHVNKGRTQYVVQLLFQISQTGLKMYHKDIRDTLMIRSTSSPDTLITQEELINLQQKYISVARKNFDNRLLFQMQQIEHIRELIIER